MYTIVNLFCLLLIVGIHEYGHFFFAKKFGLKVPQFSIGFGPKLISFFKDGTEFSVRAIPFGGYVSLPPENEIKKLSAWKQVMISAGGPMANLLLCILVTVVLRGFSDVLNTVLIFLALVPLTMASLWSIAIHPIAGLKMISGPIAIFSGNAIPNDWLVGLPMWRQALLTIYILSLVIGSFNLMPISILDGGRIFQTLLCPFFPRFVRVWHIATSFLLAGLVFYAIGGDIIKILLKVVVDK
ncbi:MAG: site-2 protease family protein [bacterium]